jgi:NAD(P)-dependent dehydrogenase (short-subunit alcohol dehydrogenase family)
MAGRMAGKIALITGAAQGLGQAMADMFIAEGARVFMTDVNAAKVATAASAHGDKAASMAQDVTSADQWQAAVAACVARFGGINVLVNNAGIGGPLANVETCTLEDWRQVHAIDLDGVFMGCKYALPAIAAYTRDSGTRGAILNISSIAGIIASANMTAYNSAKAGVRHLSKSVALRTRRVSGHLQFPASCIYRYADSGWPRRHSSDDTGRGSEKTWATNSARLGRRNI